MLDLEHVGERSDDLDAYSQIKGGDVQVRLKNSRQHGLRNQ